MSREKFLDFFAYYRGEEWQKEGIGMLYDRIFATNPDIVHSETDWVTTYKGSLHKAPAKVAANPLPVQYCYQTDDGPDGWRLCQSCTIAMGLFGVGFAQKKGWKDELPYIRELKKHGDSTDQAAHQRALAALKAPGRFITNCTVQQAKHEIDQGRPVAAALLHHGSTAHPTGGHWILLVGYDDTGWIVNDPYGSLDLVGGTWERADNRAGDHVHYSYKNMNPRWQVEGPGSGWAWTFSG